MYVDAFWFGCLVTIVVELILLCIGAYVHLLQQEKEEKERKKREERAYEKRD